MLSQALSTLSIVPCVPQTLERDETMPVPAPETPMLNICIIGETDAAEKLSSCLSNKGHRLVRMPEGPSSPAELHHHHNKLFNFHPDIIIFATQTSRFRAVVSLFPATVYENVLVMSYLPVMTPAREFLVEFLPASSGILTAGQIVGDWANDLLFVDLVRARTSNSMYQRVCIILTVFHKQTDTFVCKFSNEDYDDSMVQSAFIPTVIGKTIKLFELYPTPRDAEYERALLQMAEGDGMLPDDIFYELFRHNPFAKRALDRLEKSLKRIREELEAKEEQELRLSRQ